jgi:GT2 family glycosyltransferase
VFEPGLQNAIHAALEDCATDLMAILDDDAVPCAGWLEALLNVMREPAVAVAGGRVLTPGSTVRMRRNPGQISWYGQYMGNVGAMEVSTPLSVDSVMDGNSIWRTEVMRRLKFRAIFEGAAASMYALDLTLQAKELGYSVLYDSRARVLHTPGPRAPGLPKRSDPAEWWFYSRNYTFIALQHLRGAQRLLFIPWWWLVGQRGSYGLVTAAVDLWNRKLQWARLRACMAGKAEGVRAWLLER